MDLPRRAPQRVQTYGVALLVVGILMVSLLRSLRGGLASLVPNLMPMLATLGLMGFVGVPVNFFTLLIGSIALGVSVDDTIHLWHHSLSHQRRSGDAREAVRHALSTSGVALFFTSTALVVGFLVFGFASLRALHAFGALAAFSVGVAFVADVLVSPALLTLLSPKAAGGERRVVSARQAEQGAA